MKNPTFTQKLQYWFDNFMSRGTIALIGGLAIISLLIVAFAAAIIHFGNIAMGSEAAPGFLEAAWMSLMRTLDAGTMGGDTGTGFRIVMLFVTLGGIFMVSALIGILNTGLEARIEQLRKGRSLVLEKDHTLILGWSSQIFNIISELILANENRTSGAVIVILADRDKVEMEDTLREKITNTRNTKIICRSGNPIDLTDLNIVNPKEARSIIILPEGSDPDIHVIKSVLALTNNPNRSPNPYHIVTQINKPSNMDVIKMISEKDQVQAILTNDLIARIIAQTSRQSGLSVVYTELMDFGGDEIYFKNEPALIGKTYGESLLAFNSSTLMGIRKSDNRILMNPPMDTIIKSDDHIFALAEDDDKIELSGVTPPPINEKQIQETEKKAGTKPEKALILGWNSSGIPIIRELENYVSPNSEVLVVADGKSLENLKNLNSELTKQKITAQEGDICQRELLEDIHAADYDHVIVLAYNHLPPDEADAITLITLLHLRHIAERDATPFSIVSEMLDLHNRELAEAAKVDDFIVSEHLIGLMMAQLSENGALFDVFTDIFDPDGSEIYLKPIENYIILGQPVNFYTITEAARRRGETALGYRLFSESHDPAKAYGVHTNPVKSEEVIFSSQDKIIVLADN